jgi:V/A-type H+-transporting ATPase subunit E
MSDEVSKIINQLQTRVNEANQKAETIVKDADAKAQEIIKNAQTEAEKKLKAAEEEISRKEKAHDEKLKQAVRDTLIELKEKTIQSVLNKTFDATLKENLTDPNIVGNAIMEIAQQFAKTQDSDIRVILSPAMYEKLGDALKKQAHKIIKNNLQIESEGAIKGGFKIGIAKEGYVYDFSTEALAELFSTAYGSQIKAQIFNEEK